MGSDWRRPDISILDLLNDRQRSAPTAPPSTPRSRPRRVARPPRPRVRRPPAPAQTRPWAWVTLGVIIGLAGSLWVWEHLTPTDEPQQSIRPVTCYLDQTSQQLLCPSTP